MNTKEAVQSFNVLYMQLVQKAAGMSFMNAAL